MNNIRTVYDNLDVKCDKYEHYFPLYETHFSKFIGKSPRILEIGVQYGGSAELWRKYFGEGTQVVGVDIDPKCKETEYLQILTGDQGDPSFWNSFCQKYKEFDIIIDDGSHDNPHQILTLERTYNLLVDGGVYWCEDTHTSYYNNVRKVTNGGYLNKNNFVEYTKNLIDVLHEVHVMYYIGGKNNMVKYSDQKISSKFLELYKKIQGIHFYDSIVVIDKGPKIQLERVLCK